MTTLHSLGIVLAAVVAATLCLAGAQAGEPPAAAAKDQAAAPAKEEPKLPPEHVLAASAEALWNDPAALVAGNAQGTASIVYFIDYESHGAHAIQSKLREFLKANGEVKLIIKPVMLMGPLSGLSGRAAYAAARQDKFGPMHEAMLGEIGRLTWIAIQDHANMVKLDRDKLRADLDSPEVVKLVEDNTKLAQALGITGSPAFVAGTSIVSGPWNKIDLARLAADAKTAAP